MASQGDKANTGDKTAAGEKAIADQTKAIQDQRTGPVPLLTPEEIKAVSGSLKVHLRLNLVANISITADIKGDVVLGIL